MTTTIKISDELAKEIDQWIGYVGFTSRTDFIRKAILKQIGELKDNV
jgi:metal-responsive CopG/Arc/MetJ family transcriptional regulator